MMNEHDLQLADIRCVHAGARDVAKGLLAFVSFRIGNALLVDGVTVRRTRDNRIVLSWPCRLDSAGQKHAILRPLSDEARKQLERRILKALAENRPEVTP